MRSPPFLVAALLLLAAGDADWRLRLPVTPAPGGGVQRIELPAGAILAMRRGDGGDVRVLDADGRAQPIARLPTPVPPGRRQTLEPLPIFGAADALTVTGVTLKVDDGQARVVRLDGTPAGGGDGQALLGVLLDTRAVDAPARELALDVTAPANQPITIRLESSTDLQDWSPDGEKVLFRTGAPAPFALPLDERNLAGRMLRVTWRAQGRLLSPVSITGAALVLAGSPDAARVAVRATVPPLRDPRTAEFALPFAATTAALRVETAAGGIPTPFQLFGRGDREQPWVKVGDGVAAPDGKGASIELDQPYREWQVKADGNGDGFAAPPTVELRFAPVTIAFIAAGRPPYTLAVGRDDTGPSFLPLDTLRRMDAGGGPMPTATVAAGAATPVALGALADGPSRKTWLLWGVLLLGVAALGAMAWTLARPKRA